jgi:hypothetical protein
VRVSHGASVQKSFALYRSPIYIHNQLQYAIGFRSSVMIDVSEARYINIVDERLVVWTETIRDLDKPLATNITTLEFVPEDQRTRLKVTVQVTSFVGASMIKNTKAGHEGSLASMARYLER